MRTSSSALVRLLPLLAAARGLRLEAPACQEAAAVLEDRGRLASGRVCGGGPYTPPECPACKLHGDNAPRLFVPTRGDGLGERALSLIWYMALAASYGFNFGGVLLSDELCTVSHGVDTLAAMSSLLGQDVNTLFLESTPRLDFSYDSQKSLLGSLPRLRNCPGANIGLRPQHVRKRGQQDPATYWTVAPSVSRDFLAALRQGAQFLKRSVRYRPGDLTVALHVRREDVTRHMNDERFIPDEWYYKLVKNMSETYKVKMDVHVFSSTGTRYDEADFEGFRERGMTVHLDDDVLDDWAHMARADILVMALSSFSFIPAILSQQCVLDPKHWTQGSSSWTELVHLVPVSGKLEFLDSPGLQDALAECMKFAAPQRKTGS